MNSRLPTLAISIVAVATTIFAVGCGGAQSSGVAEGDPSGAPITAIDDMTTAAGDAAQTSTSAVTTSSTEPIPILDDIALIQLTGPDTVGDVAPEFSWTPVVGATSYRLVVLTNGEPSWAWQGETTSTRLGGLTADAGPAFPAPELTDGSTWSVVALDADGGVLAASELRTMGL